MKYLILIVFLFAKLVFADGWSNLSGTTAKGEKILIGPSALKDSDYMLTSDGKGLIPKPEAYLYYDIYVILGKNKKKYERQTCETDWKTFSCALSGTSPLAGTNYKIIKNPNKDCSYQYKFVCTAGCSNESVPKEMLYEWWECEN